MLNIKHIAVLIVALLCVVCIVPAMAFSGNGNGMDGNGTIGNPFIITNVTQWYQANSDEPTCNGGWMSGYAHYALGNNITFGGNEDPAIHCFDGALDGRGYALINFRNTTIVPTIGSSVATGGYGIISHTYADYMKNIALINCTLIYSEDLGSTTGTSKYDYYGIFIGQQGGGEISNIYIDDKSLLNLTHPTIGGYGSVIVGTVAGNAYYLKNVVSRASINIVAPFGTDPNAAYRTGGGVSGSVINAVSGVTNILSAGHIYYTPENTDYMSTVIGGNVLLPAEGSSWYYDSTTLAGVPVKPNTYGVPTSGMGTISNFPNLTFAENKVGWADPESSTYMTMYNGYPIPLYFYPYGRFINVFHATPVTGIVPAAIQFTDDSYASGTRPYSATAWLWSFGDGTTSTSQNPYKLYTGSGNYTVSLKVSSEHDADNTTTKVGYINVSGAGSNPLANFYATPTSGSAPLVVQMVDTSTGSPTSWAWTFGDGGTSTNQYPYHTYSANGIYTVSLTVGNIYGNDTLTRTAYIVVPTPTTAIPTPTPTPTPVPTGTPVPPGTQPAWFVDAADNPITTAVQGINYIHIKFDTLTDGVAQGYVAFIIVGQKYNATSGIWGGDAQHEFFLPYLHAPYGTTTYYGYAQGYSMFTLTGGNETNKVRVIGYSQSTAALTPGTYRAVMIGEDAGYNLYYMGVPSANLTITASTAPTTSPTYLGTISFVKSDGSAWGSTANIEQYPFVKYDTVTNGTAQGWTKYIINIQKQDAITGVWSGISTTPSQTIHGAYGSSTYYTTPGTSVWISYTADGLVGGAAVRNVGRTDNITFPSTGTYRAVLYSYDGSDYHYNAMSSTITVSSNPLNVDNFGDWVASWGGTGMKMIIAAAIVIVMMLLPFILMRSFSTFIELMAMFLGIGISYFAGLLDLWIMVVIILVAVAIIAFGLRRPTPEGG